MSGAYQYPSSIGQYTIGLSPIGGAPPSPGVPWILVSYLYWQYRSLSIGPNGEPVNDPAIDSLQAFISSYNQNAQNYNNWFNSVILPDWTNQYIVGLLLDWIGQGLYGYARPVLPSGRSQTSGPLDTWALNTIPLDTLHVLAPQVYYANDDVYKRCLTWHLFKGDGKQFTIRWLKRRVLRFLLGASGTNVDTSNTQRISVTFGPSIGEVTIRLITVIGSVRRGAILNTLPLNGFYLNEVVLQTITFPQYAFGPILQAAVAAGVLELPFSKNFSVQLT